jgi:hypothetical protein
MSAGDNGTNGNGNGGAEGDAAEGVAPGARIDEALSRLGPPTSPFGEIARDLARPAFAILRVVELQAQQLDLVDKQFELLRAEIAQLRAELRVRDAARETLQ